MSKSSPQIQALQAMTEHQTENIPHSTTSSQKFSERSSASNKKRDAPVEDKRRSARESHKKGKQNDVKQDIKDVMLRHEVFSIQIDSWLINVGCLIIALMLDIE